MMEGKLALFQLLSSFLLCNGRYLVPIPVKWDGDRPKNMLDAINGDSLIQLSDAAQRYTVIRDKTMKTCFITNYDPMWSLELSERQDYVDTKTHDLLKTRDDLDAFVRKVGVAIGTLCKKENIIWLTVDKMPIPIAKMPAPAPKPFAPLIKYDDGDQAPPHMQPIPTRKPQFQGGNGVDNGIPVPTKRPEFQKLPPAPFPVSERVIDSAPHMMKVPTKKPEFQNKELLNPESSEPEVSQPLNRKDGEYLIEPPKVPQGVPLLKKDVPVPANIAQRAPHDLIAPPKVPQLVPALKRDLA